MSPTNLVRGATGIAAACGRDVGGDLRDRQRPVDLRCDRDVRHSHRRKLREGRSAKAVAPRAGGVMGDRRRDLYRGSNELIAKRRDLDQFAGCVSRPASTS